MSLQHIEIIQFKVAAQFFDSQELPNIGEMCQLIAWPRQPR
jgi:hypothetical protein